jgi:hypothetical protein
MLETVTFKPYRKNIPGAMDAFKSGIDTSEFLFADGKLVRYEDRKPEMGPFFYPGPGCQYTE